MEQEQYTQENSKDFDYGFDYGSDYGSDYENENETERLEVGAEPAEDQEAMDFEDNNEQLEDTHPINIEERMDNIDYTERTSIKLYALKIKCNLSTSQMKMVADLFESVLDEYVPGFKCLSQFRCKTLIQSLYPVKPVYHDICRQGCFLFGDETQCPKCKKPRYKENQSTNTLLQQTATTSPSNTIITGTAARRMKILPIGGQIASLIYHHNTRQMLLNNFHNPTDTYRDIFDGSIFRGMDSDPNDLYIGLYIDGFSTNNKKAQCCG
ncbi:hypothetical protein, partial, partial [Absidia glauca]